MTKDAHEDQVMSYGKYQGKKMSEVPESYLKWLEENHKLRWKETDWLHWKQKVGLYDPDRGK